ncbi:hypothetical protein J2X19_002603 [Rhodoferax ferrireducens]|uniref:NACHT domain-containing protein n=1 Tax=Rhodoferax ferrireducens TaxID=192843 RepID=A0ABU2C9B3_9BURK|nr:hypothetical protein [Rhodoferax ferrireducens]MDR7377924.1 hypothetical protein [Rhodoferax ferrireducens]
MVNSYELGGLDPYAFENLVNLLALKVLGPGSSGFGPGPDGGRDGFFEGEAPYPSITENWKGIWYIQSKFHAPHLSKNPQKWLIEKVKGEIELFEESDNGRLWPDNWIIATNIDPSGKSDTGSFDAIRSLVDAATRKKVNIAIWGGNKILGLLSQYPDVAQQYAHFITPGEVLSALQNQLTDQYANISSVIRYLVGTQFSEQIYTKLDQAGSSSDTRPGVHHLFIDLPFSVDESDLEGSALDYLCSASAQPQRYSVISQYSKVWRDWRKNPHRARVALLKGGPGQGKSTVGQYFSQIQRAALLLLPDAPVVTEKVKNLALEVKVAADRIGAWPSAPRIPIFIELKEYAHWFGQKSNDEGRGVLSYLANRIAAKIEQNILPNMLRRALSVQSWFVLFDGLDEVPNDVKDLIADEVNNFINEIVVQEDADVLTLCTSRPQGYSGQFSALDGPILILQKLDVDTAILCAEPVVRYDRSEDEGTRSLELLKSAAASQSVQQLMTTPLQSHIMAVVVRDGGRPPELRWALFENFYQVMKKRESLKNVHNPRISRLLREDDRLIRAVHARLGFELHARAERSEGAQTTLTKAEFRALVTYVVEKLSDDNTNNTVDVVMEAMTERLVLVSTPENGAHVRFDIRQLQEFFASEFLYDVDNPSVLASRIEVVGGDSHWLEVMHFLLSALVENRRTTELDVAIKVLERLNEGNNDGVYRLFYRRMAKGAVLGMRLLIEGVLEQDKRDRLRFKTLFEPIGGLLDVSFLRNLNNVRAPNSRNWLINVLSEKIAEANFSESIGAIIALGWLLPNEHGLNRDLLKCFHSLSAKYQQVALDAWNTLDYHRNLLRNEEHVSIWVIAAALRIAGSEDQWRQLDSTGKENLRTLLTGHAAMLPAACRLAEIPPNLSNLIIAIFDVRIRDDKNVASKKEYGPVYVHLLQHNWANGSLPPEVLEAWSDCKNLKSNGMFEIILALIKFSQTSNFDDLQVVLKIMSPGSEDFMAAIPDWMIGLFPCRGEHYLIPYDCSHLRAMNRQSFSKFVDEKDVDACPPIVFRGLNHFNGQNITYVGWDDLFRHLPFIGVNILMSRNFEHLGINVAQREEYLPLVEKSLLQSARFAKANFLYWGIFYKKNPNIISQLRAVVEATDYSSGDDVFGLTEPTPFPIARNDGALICLLTKGIFQGFRYRSENEWPEVMRKAASSIKDFGLTVSDFDTLADNPENNLEIRISGWLLGIICTEKISVKDRLLTVLGEISRIDLLLKGKSAGWCVESLCILMQKELGEPYMSAITTTDALLNTCRDKVELRNPLSRMLSVWREASSSPVHSNQILQKWLEQ